MNAGATSFTLPPSAFLAGHRPAMPSLAQIGGRQCFQPRLSSQIAIVMAPPMEPIGLTSRRNHTTANLPRLPQLTSPR